MQTTVGGRTYALECLEDFESSVDKLFAEMTQTAATTGFDPNKDPLRFEALCPYFGVLWPPARVLSDYLMRLGELVLHGKRVLELGCGLALPSIVAASLEAEVTASDWHEDVPRFLARNIALNGLGPMAYRRADWFGDAAAFADLGFFDVIIGSDVLYDPAHPSGLLRVIERHLAPHGTVLIADANRSYAATFAQLMDAAGFDCRMLEQTVTGNLPRQSTAEIVVKIYEFLRR
jgi:predicted nicotinamide N-methyase